VSTITTGCERIGHGGASALVAANTLASFDAAVQIGVDTIEFDVRAARGELVLAHTALDARREPGACLREALAHLCAPRYHEIGLNVDLKHPGCEGVLLDALWDAGLLERTVVCSQLTMVLDRIRALEPRARTGISIGGRLARLSRRWADWRGQVLAGIALRRWDVLMAQHKLVDAGLLSDVAARGGLLYAWTVNDRSEIDRLRGLGVHGIVSADPRLVG